MDKFTEVWNEAYNIYCEDGNGSEYKKMMEFLHQQVENGFLSEADAQTMAEDVIETASL